MTGILTYSTDVQFLHTVQFSIIFIMYTEKERAGYFYTWSGIFNIKTYWSNL
jgi:hypothetical protein